MISSPVFFGWFCVCRYGAFAPSVAQRLLQIGDDVIRVLQTNGHPDHAIGNAGGLPDLLGDHGVGHGGSLLHQRFRIAQRDGQRAELQAVDELLTGLQTAGHVKGDHAASVLHLLLGDGVLGIGFQEGIADR